MHDNVLKITGTKVGRVTSLYWCKDCHTLWTNSINQLHCWLWNTSNNAVCFTWILWIQDQYL